MAKAGGQERPPIPPGGGGQSYLDWSAHIRVKKHEYEETFSIFIFLGDVPKDPEDWYSSPSFVGEHSVMVHGGGQPRRDKDTFVEGVIHLNRVIAARSGLPSFEEDVVVPYLKENIAWRVRTITGQVIELDEQTSLEVTVFSVRVSKGPASDPDTFPSHGKPQYYRDITAGRLGGARPQ